MKLLKIDEGWVRFMYVESYHVPSVNGHGSFSTCGCGD